MTVMNVPNPVTKDITIQHRREIDTLVVRWHGESDTQKLKDTYEYLLEFAADNNLYKWLLDSRRRDETNPELSMWLKDTMLEKVLPVMHHSVRMAYLISPRRWNELRERKLVMPEFFEGYTKRLDHYECISETFVYESDAYEWLDILVK
jgi:succinate dehydrogenase flavin-adding protein (antitoxin of CptAB toxin-antitoxin module)